MTLLCDTSVQMKAALEAVDHLQLCDAGTIQGRSVCVYNDRCSQLHIVEVDAHRLQRSSAHKVWSGSEGPREPTEQAESPESRRITKKTHRGTFSGFAGLVYVSEAL